MAKKRFTDAEKWQDPWFRALPPDGKVAWTYVCDTCDAAGVLSADPERFEFETRLGTPFDQVMTILGDRVRRLDARRMLIVKFVEFQYPKGLNPKSDAQANVIALLQKHGLPLPGTSQVGPTKLGRTSQQDTETDTDTESDSDSNARATPPTTSLPLAQTKPGILELRQIPGLKLHPDSHPEWLSLAAEVGLEVIRLARDEVVAAGKDCWAADVSVAALRIHRTKRRSIVDQRAQERQQSASAEQAQAAEAFRIRQRDEAIAFMTYLDEHQQTDQCDQEAIRALRQLVAYSQPGQPTVGFAHLMKKISKSIQMNGAANESV